MATLEDLKGILESIDSSMTEQKKMFSNMLSMQQTKERLSSVDTSASQPVDTNTVGQNIGAAVSGIGAGVGSAAAGVGFGGLLGMGALAIFENFDAEAIKENVVTLLSISDEVGGKAETLKEGGTFFLAMTGLGIGLAAFGVGQSLNALGQWITDNEWAKTLKTNVVDLLSIADGVGGNLNLLYEGGSVGLALGGLGAGLGVFSAGSAAAGLAQFIAADGWAQRVKDSVATLLSISELPGIGWNTVEFIGVMTGISAGLAAFATGKGAATVVEGAAEAIKLFTGDNFADKIKSEVGTLLSISQMEGVGANTIEFISTMAGIAAGLTAFALGKGAATVVEGAAEAIAYFTGDEPFADKIKSEVETLLSIVGLAPEGSVDEFTNILSRLGNGLSSFAGSNFVGALKNAGAAIVSFFFGTESPFEQIRLIAADADNLVKAADAIEKIAKSLEKFGSINVDVGEIDFEALAINLGKSLPVLNALANGGRVGEGVFDGPEVNFGKGILDPSLKLDEMAAAISKVNYVLGQTTEYPISLRESAAGAVAESPIALAESERIRLEKEDAAVREFQAKNTLIEKQAQTQGGTVAVDAKQIDARNITTVGGSTSTTIITPRSGNDLDYGLPRGIQ